ncbi:unnamed protein product [Cylindrotheca closterium]|uniref:GH16 domain-containing protein n=1 Tax=Cylindrotheca closterium TaxID=2856 RepID=A0AAD2PWA7_9STRA|nr:unnamed protein product [Cylindrotheca closterium]
MPPRGLEGTESGDGEKSFLLGKGSSSAEDGDQQETTSTTRCKSTTKVLLGCAAIIAIVGLLLFIIRPPLANGQPKGPYKIVEVQSGKDFFNYYDFYDGADSLGSAGYQTYVSRERADELGLIDFSLDPESGKESVYLETATGADGGFRESIRLEGKQRFDRGLFLLDVEHMPAGCGVWPAFWLTDESTWPDNGEIDILEGINSQSVAKTALHTSDQCSMYAHVPAYAMTGKFDSATGIPDTFTGKLNTFNRVEADNCWVMAPHQWANQGCIIVSKEQGTIGEPMNEVGGGVYALEWDPENGYIKSWVFKRNSIPENLQESMDTASSNDASVLPDPDTWPLPYAYFAIGDKSGCSADHFKNMRLVLNTAFCGAVAGNKFAADCPKEADKFNVDGDSVLTCNAFIDDEADRLTEAYWKIRGAYVYERELE